MSYILDALSKSERERRLGEAPDLGNAPDGNAHRTNGRAMTLVAVVALNLAGLGGLYWLALDQRETLPEATTVVTVTAAPARPAAAQPPSIGVPVAARPQAAIPRPSPSPRPVLPTLAQTPAPAAATPVPPVAAVRRSHPAPRPEIAAPQATSQQPQASAEEQPQASAEEQPQALAEEQPQALAEESRAQAEDVDPTPWLVELPPKVREKLPSLSINAYYYASDPKRRFVLIDMVKYREGQRLGGGPLLERIGRDSLYLDVDGLRFRVRRP